MPGADEQSSTPGEAEAGTRLKYWLEKTSTVHEVNVVGEAQAATDIDKNVLQKEAKKTTNSWDQISNVELTRDQYNQQ